MKEFSLRAVERIAVFGGYTILGAKPDGSPKLKAHSREVEAGEVFLLDARHAEELIKCGHARLAIDGEELI